MGSSGVFVSGKQLLLKCEKASQINSIDSDIGYTIWSFAYMLDPQFNDDYPIQGVEPY